MLVQTNIKFSNAYIIYIKYLQDWRVSFEFTFVKKILKQKLYHGFHNIKQHNSQHKKCFLSTKSVY